MNLFKFAREYKIMGEPLLTTVEWLTPVYELVLRTRTKLNIGVYDRLFKTLKASIKMSKKVLLNLWKHCTKSCVCFFRSLVNDQLAIMS